MWNGRDIIITHEIYKDKFKVMDDSISLICRKNNRDRIHALYREDYYVEIFNDLSCVLTCANGKKIVFDNIDTDFEINGGNVGYMDLSISRLVSAEYDDEKLVLIFLYWDNITNNLSTAETLLRYLELDTNSLDIKWSKPINIQDENIIHILDDSTTHLIDNKMYFSTCTSFAYLDLLTNKVSEIDELNRKVDKLTQNASRSTNGVFMPVQIHGGTENFTIVWIGYNLEYTNDFGSVYCAVHENEVVGFLQQYVDENGKNIVVTYSSNLKKLQTYELSQNELNNIIFQSLEFINW